LSVIFRALLVLLLVGGIVLISFVWWRRAAYSYAEQTVQHCRAAYRRAKTLVDSQIVDAQRPVFGQGSAADATTCRLLRQQGLTK
jgi:hypothetical protein